MRALKSDQTALIAPKFKHARLFSELQWQHVALVMRITQSNHKNPLVWQPWTMVIIISCLRVQWLFGGSVVSFFSLSTLPGTHSSGSFGPVFTALSRELCSIWPHSASAKTELRKRETSNRKWTPCFTTLLQWAEAEQRSIRRCPSVFYVGFCAVWRDFSRHGWSGRRKVKSWQFSLATGTQRSEAQVHMQVCTFNVL